MDINAAKLSDFLAKALAVLVLLLAAGAFLPLLRHESGGYVNNPATGDPANQVIWLGIYVITFFLVVARWKRFVRVAARDKLLLLLTGLALISVLWSVDPGVTLRRSVALVGTTMFGAYLATRYSLSELLRLLAWTMGIAALLSLVVALALPSYGVFGAASGENYGAPQEVGWRGVFDHKNGLGHNMALSALVFLLLAFNDRSRYRLIAWIGFGLSVGLLLLSNSATSLISFLATLALLLSYRALRWHYTLTIPYFIIVTLVGGAAVSWLVGNAESVLGTLGRDLTFTGRTDLWSAVLEMIPQHPWLGYGYGAFWLGWEGESAQVWQWINLGLGLEPVYSAHNGLLDLWLNLGLMGVSTFVLGFLLTVLRAVTWARSTKTAVGFFPLAYLTFLLLSNLTEDSILDSNSLSWILYLVVALSTAVRPSRAGKTSHVDASSRRGTGAEMAETFYRETHK